MKAIKKPKQPNWECQEIVSLVQAKRKEHNASIGVVDSRDCFENTIVKWKEIVTLVMASSHSAYVRNRLACNENLWTTLYNDYKRIWNYMVKTRHDEELWNISTIDKVTMNLPKMFNMNIYEIKYIIASGEGTPMCEVDLDPKPMYIMFNVDNNMISSLATPTTYPNKLTTFTIPTNRFATLTMFLEQRKFKCTSRWSSSTKPYHTSSVQQFNKRGSKVSETTTSIVSSHA